MKQFIELRENKTIFIYADNIVALFKEHGINITPDEIKLDLDVRNPMLGMEYPTSDYITIVTDGKSNDVNIHTFNDEIKDLDFVYDVFRLHRQKNVIRITLDDDKKYEDAKLVFNCLKDFDTPIDKTQQYFDNAPKSIFDTKGRRWDSEKDYHAGSLNWGCKELSVSVYATPYFDGAVDTPVTIINDEGEEVKSWVEDIEVDATISLMTALGKVEEPKVDVSSQVRTMISAMNEISNKWDEAGLNDDVSEYPSYLPSFDEFIWDLQSFFSDRGQL